MKSKTFGSNEYCEQLEREEKRTRLLAWLENDPAKKQEHLRKNRLTKKLLSFVRKITGGGIETSKANDPETPEDILKD